MGASATKELATLDFAGGFTPEQLKRTQRRFHRLGNGRVSFEAIASTAGIQQLNPLVTSLFDHYSGMKGSGTLSYPELLVLLTDLGQSLGPSPQSRCTAVLFKAFDINGDGYVCASDLTTALSHIAGAAVPQTHLAHVAAATVAMYDHDNDDRLNDSEFAALLQEM